jgi:hypothetical protein
MFVFPAPMDALYLAGESAVTVKAAMPAPTDFFAQLVSALLRRPAKKASHNSKDVQEHL